LKAATHDDAANGTPSKSLVSTRIENGPFGASNTKGLLKVVPGRTLMLKSMAVVRTVFVGVTVAGQELRPVRELQDKVVGAPRCDRVSSVPDDDLDLDHTVTSLGLGAANRSKLALGQCRLFHGHERLFGPVVGLD
jgi:hypothetical protein